MNRNLSLLLRLSLPCRHSDYPGRPEDQSDEYTTYIGGNNYEIGRQAGFFVNRQVKEKYPTVLEVWGLSGSSPAQDAIAVLWRF